MTFMGAETEFGIATPTYPELSPIVTATHAVATYAAFHTQYRSRWDYQDEYPLRDIRGFDLRRYHTVPIVSPDQIGVANLVLPNGGRFYVDHAHPEYATPETSNAWDAMVYDAAGNLVLTQAAHDVHTLSTQGGSAVHGHQPCPPLRLYKNNTDGKGHSYGSHENYLYSADLSFQELADQLIPFFVARQIIIGAGRMGLGPHLQKPGFQISQRADFIDQEISLETTMNRGIINTRHEPHTRGAHRLHVIVGDACMSQTSNFLKFGMTSLVLDAIEAGVDFGDLRLQNGVESLKAVSRDLELHCTLPLADGRRLSALTILQEYAKRVTPSTPIEQRVYDLWHEVMELLAKDPLSTSHLLDWTAKWALIRGFMDRGVHLGDPRLELIDLQYSDINPSRSLYYALVAKGRMDTLAEPSDIERAASTPPQDTRAALRGTIVERFEEYVESASWQSILLNTPQGTVTLHLDTVEWSGDEIPTDFHEALRFFERHHLLGNDHLREDAKERDNNE